jgi:hypothetical protein
VIAPVVNMAAVVWNASCRVPVDMIAAGASSTPNVFTYSATQEFGARLATQHLIDLGHTDITHVAGSFDWFDGRVRKRGWEAALRDAGLSRGSASKATVAVAGLTKPASSSSAKAVHRSHRHLLCAGSSCCRRSEISSLSIRKSTYSSRGKVTASKENRTVPDRVVGLRRRTRSPSGPSSRGPAPVLW